jgi:hypothetical protein
VRRLRRLLSTPQGGSAVSKSLHLAGASVRPLAYVVSIIVGIALLLV